MTREELYALHEKWYEGGMLNNDQISAVMELALEAFRPEIAAICELDGCCMLRDKTGPQAEKT